MLYNFSGIEAEKFYEKVNDWLLIIDTWYNELIPYGDHPFFFINACLTKNITVPNGLLNPILKRFKLESNDLFKKEFPLLAKKAGVATEKELTLLENYFGKLDFSTIDKRNISIKQMWKKIEADCPKGNETTGKITQEEGAKTIHFLLKIHKPKGKIYGKHGEILAPSYIRNIIQNQ